MFKRLYQRLVMLMIVVLCATMLVPAQSATDQSTPGALATGTPPLGTYGGSSFDQVNLFNGNLSMSFPLAGLDGRAGLGASVTLAYNSKIWRVEQKQYKDDLYYVPTYNHWDTDKPGFALGWNFNVGRMIGRQTTWFDDEKHGRYGLTTFTFTSPDGTEYDFRDDLTNGEPLSISHEGNNQSRARRFHSVDGTAATFVSTLEIFDQYKEKGLLPQIKANGTLILRDGTRFIIQDGKVLEQHDRNGNIVKYSYQGARLTGVTDTLGRTITIQYIDGANNDNFKITVTHSGFGGATRVTTIKFGMLGTALRSDEHLIDNVDLFPDLDTPANRTGKFNPLVIKKLELPSGHTWEFQYNGYGEMARVKTPANGAIEYEYDRSNGPVIAGSTAKQEILRRVTLRRTYANANVDIFESKTRYSDPSLKDGSGNPVPVTEEVFANDNTRLAATRHTYAYTPLDNYGVQTGVPKYTGYQPWMEGKEIKSEVLDANDNPKQITEYTWEQREAVQWVTMNRNFAAQPANDPRLKRTRTTQECGEVSIVEYDYDDNNGYGGFNNIIAERTYDGPTLVRTVTRTYANNAEYVFYKVDDSDPNKVTKPHLRSLLLSEIIGVDIDHPETKTIFEYDNSSLTSLTFGASDTTHDPNYDIAFTLRGNVTKVTKGISETSSGQTQGETSSIQTQYDIAGNIIETIGPLPTQIVNMEYSANFKFAYLTQTTQTIPTSSIQFISKNNYDLSTGLLISTTGFNNEVSSYFYEDPDHLDRLTKIVRPTGAGMTEYRYSAPGEYPSYVETKTQIDGQLNLISTNYVDGQLKPIKQEHNDPQGTVTTEVTYDGLNRPVIVKNPYRASISADTDGYTKTDYDQIGRVIKIETFTANNVSTGAVISTYCGRTVLVKDQANKERKSVADALGRLITVFEPDNTGALIQNTDYQYDARGNLCTVLQGIQLRRFVYDSLGRLKEATAPEKGTTLYTYDEAYNLTTRTDDLNRITSFTYDALNRPLTKTYSDGTPGVSYFYDNTDGLPQGIALPDNYNAGAAKGRLVAIITNFPMPQKPAGSFYSYDIAGRVTNFSQLLDDKHYQSSTSYNAASLPITESYPSTSVFATEYNSAGQVTNIKRGNKVFADTTEYTAGGALSEQRLGNNLYHSIDYNSRLQPTTIKLGTTSKGSELWQLAYNYGKHDLQDLSANSNTIGTSLPQDMNNGNIGRITITPGAGATPIEQNFAYDELNRLKLAKEFVQHDDDNDGGDNGGNGSNGGDDCPIRAYDPFNTDPFDTPALVIIGPYMTGDDFDEKTRSSQVSLTNLDNKHPMIYLHANVTGIRTDVATYNIRVEGEDNGSGRPLLKEFSGTFSNSQPVGYRYNNVAFDTFDLTPYIGQVIHLTISGSVQLQEPRENGTIEQLNVFAYTFCNPLAEAPIKFFVDGETLSGDVREGTDEVINVSTSTTGYTANGGYNGPVALSIQSVAPGLHASFGENRTTIDLEHSTLLTVGTNGTLADGTYDVVVVGQATVNGELETEPLTLHFVFGDEEPPSNLTHPSSKKKVLRLVKVQSKSNNKERSKLQLKTGNKDRSKLQLKAGNKGLSNVVEAQESWRRDYDYDRYGNILKNPNTGDPILVYNNNRLREEDGYHYDDVGNLTQDPDGKHYTYDAENRLIEVTDNSNTLIAQYTYDGNGLRIKKFDTTAGLLTRFIYNGGGQLLEEYEGTTALTITKPAKEYVYGPSGLLAIAERTSTDPNNETIQYLTTDQLGSPRVITNDNGDIVNRRDFYPFGEEITSDVGGRNIMGLGYNSDSIKQRFTGYQRDNETGLDFAQARYYGSFFGRFTSPDPLMSSGSVTNPQSWNRYTYTLNNPLKYVDPTGLLTDSALSAGQFIERDEEKYFSDIKESSQNKVIYVFIAFTQAEQSTTTNTGAKFTVPPPDFQALEQTAKNNNITLKILAGPKATKDAFEEALQDKDATAVIFIGHSLNIRDGNVKGEDGKGILIGKSLQLNDGEFRSFIDPITVKTNNVLAFGCDSQAVSESFNLRDNQRFIGVDGGEDKVSSTFALTRAGYLATKALVENKSPDAAIKAANAAFSSKPLLVGNNYLTRFPIDLNGDVVK